MATLAIEDICNLALRRIGYPTPIGFVFEGSVAARVAVEIYSQTRDDLLREDDWDFARQAVTLTLLKTAPVGGYVFTPWTSAYPPPPWTYEYEYPTDCLEMRTVRPLPVLLSEYDPSPNVFIVAHDATITPPGPAILTNLRAAQGVYTASVSDTSQWTTGYTNALIDALATRFQEALAPEDNAVKLRLAEQQQGAAMAATRRG